MAEKGMAAGNGTIMMGADAAGLAQFFKVGPNGELASVSSAAEYETVAASATDQVLGATGAIGDYLAAILIIPGTTSPGAVSIKDGAGSGITIFTGGATSVLDLKPILVPLGIRCTGAGWKVTTGTNVTAIGIGDFT